MEHARGPRLGPVAVGLQTCGPPGAAWQLWIPEPRASALPRGERLHVAFFLKQPFLCAGVWDQKEWAEDSQGFRVPVWASVAPERDRTSAEGTPSLAPTGLGPGIYRAMEAQLSQSAVCTLLALGPEGGMGHPVWAVCALGPLRSTNAVPLATSWPQGECI